MMLDVGGGCPAKCSAPDGEVRYSVYSSLVPDGTTIILSQETRS